MKLNFQILSDKRQETTWALLRTWLGRFLHLWLIICVLQSPKNENWVLLILIRETLNKIYLDTVLLAFHSLSDRHFQHLLNQSVPQVEESWILVKQVSFPPLCRKNKI